MINYENYDPFFPDQPVVDLYLSLWSSLPAFHSKPAFIWSEDGGSSSTLTYGDLNNSVHSISTNLLTQLKRQDTIVILCSPGLDLVEIIFACQRAGLLGVPIVPPDPNFCNNNYHHLVRALLQTKPKAAIAHSGYIQRIRQYCSSATNDVHLSKLLKNLKWISTIEIKRNINSKGNNLGRYSGCKAEEAYLIQYTSGATGIPKPVIVTAGSAAHNVRTARRAYDLHPNSVIVSWLPQYHDCGLMFLLLTIVSGATCVLTSPTAFITRPRLWLELISEYKATCTPVPSFTLPLVLKRGGVHKGTRPLDLRSMKNLIIINEPIYKSSVDDFVDVFKNFGLNACSISPSYGLAEHCTFVSTAWRSGGQSDSFPTYKNLLPSARLSSKSSGAEEDDVEILVVNEGTHEPVRDGVEGEIWISSVSNASGYLGHPSLTREVFQNRLSNKVSRCFGRTGDRGIVKGEERYLFVTGRSADLIKLENGREIHPHYIETSAYNSCRKILRGGCIAAFEVSKTVVVVAEMQKTGEGKKICEGIRKNVINDEKVELGLVVLVKSGNVPKTTSGKIQRWAAKDKLLEGKMDVVMHMKFGEIETVNSEFMSKMMIMNVNEKRTERRNLELDQEHASDVMLHSSL